MKIGRLVKLAKRDDSVLTHYARIWDEKQNGKKAGKGGDPVSLALEWYAGLKSCFLWAAGSFSFTLVNIIVVRLVLSYVSELPLFVTNAWTFLIVLSSMCFISFTSATYVGIRKRPEETKKFLEVITFIERLPLPRETISNTSLNSYGGRIGPLSCENFWWGGVPKVNEAALEFLCKQAKQIQEREPGLNIPWRKQTVSKQIARDKRILYQHQTMLRLLIDDIPENWGYFFGDKTS